MDEKICLKLWKQHVWNNQGGGVRMEVKMKREWPHAEILGEMGTQRRFIQLSFVLLDRFQISHNIYLFYKFQLGTGNH